MKKIRKGDEVIVIAGKDKGAVGNVLSVIIAKTGQTKVLVEGVNIKKKHVKPNPEKQITGGVVSKAMPIDVSNVAIYNSESKKADRVGFKIGDDGKKVRIFKSTGQVVVTE